MDNKSLDTSTSNTQPTPVDPVQMVAAKLKESHSVLVTVSNNPSVDQLASCIGLTLLLNKMGKHATAVFSGAVPSTIEFLQPEKTLEKNTDSLRDFIIALDKSKADRLRYKVEDKYVKIFITPYKTSITEKDLEFSQGDLNCDVIVALGVHHQQELDSAIMAHGRILHDATIISINTNMQQNNLGTMNWQDDSASSLAELITNLAGALSDTTILDAQNSTALLTGIVASTKRFANEKTAPKTMNASALLLAAGANQQLVAQKLEPPVTPPPAPVIPPPAPPIAKIPMAPPAPLPPVAPPPIAKTPVSNLDQEGRLDLIKEEPKKPVPLMQQAPKEEDVDLEQIRIDSTGTLYKLTDENGKPFQNPVSSKASDSGEKPEDSSTPPTPDSSSTTGSAAPPAAPSDGTAPTTPDTTSVSGTSLPPVSPPSTSSSILASPSSYEPLSSEPDSSSAPPVTASTPSSSSSAPSSSVLGGLSSMSTQVISPTVPPAPAGTETLEQIEKDVASPHLASDPTLSPTPDVDAARNAVLAQADSAKPPMAFNSMTLGPDLHTENTQVTSPTPQSLDMPLPTRIISPSTGPGAPPTSSLTDPTSPPPVPPPIMPSSSIL